MDRELFELGRRGNWWDFRDNFTHLSDFTKENLQIWIGGWLAEWPPEPDDDEYREWLTDILFKWIHRTPYRVWEEIDPEPNPTVEMLPDSNERYFDLLKAGYRLTGSRYKSPRTYDDQNEWVGDPHFGPRYLQRLGKVLLEMGFIEGEIPKSRFDMTLARKIDQKSDVWHLMDKLDLGTDKKADALAKLWRIQGK